ncbi:MAG: glycosyltransferase [Henriciella sp.]|nr:glycosyltransferase [Henriciella sp.]
MTLSRPMSEPTETAIPVGQTAQGEEVVSNGVCGEATLSICVPTWKDGADALFASLVRLDGAGRCTLLVYDDGSSASDLTRQLTRQILRFPGPARLITASSNQGRAIARNRLQALAETRWILFLDADMRPDDDQFLLRYLEMAATLDAPALVPGGFSLKYATPTIETKLHAAQSEASECVSAEIRRRAPGRFVFTSNLMVHREILENIEFDPGFTGWGWEDVDWGLQVAGRYDIHHIDNPATHLGLDTDDGLIAKYGGSGANFARLVQRHPAAMETTPLYKSARWLSRLPGRSALAWLARRIALGKAWPLQVRLYGLKLYRAAKYAPHLEK